MPDEINAGLGVIVAVVVLGLVDGELAGEVAAILLVEGERLVLQMAHDEHPPVVGRSHYAHTALGTVGQDAERRVAEDIGSAHLGVAAVGHGEGGRQSLHQRRGEAHRLGEDAETLLGQGVFGHAIQVVEARLRAPTNVERGAHRAVGPVDDAAKGLPIAHVLEGDLLNGGTRDDEAIVGRGRGGIALEVAIVGIDIGHRRGLVRLSGYLHQQQAHVLARLRQGAGDVEVGHGLVGHEVEQ